MGAMAEQTVQLVYLDVYRRIDGKRLGPITQVVDFEQGVSASEPTVLGFLLERSGGVGSGGAPGGPPDGNVASQGESGGRHQ